MKGDLFMQNLWIHLENNVIYILYILVCYFGYKKIFYTMKSLTTKEKVFYTIRFLLIGIVGMLLYIYLRKVVSV